MNIDQDVISIIDCKSGDLGILGNFKYSKMRKNEEYNWYANSWRACDACFVFKNNDTQAEYFSLTDHKSILQPTLILKNGAYDSKGREIIIFNQGKIGKLLVLNSTTKAIQLFNTTNVCW